MYVVAKVGDKLHKSAISANLSMMMKTYAFYFLDTRKKKRKFPIEKCSICNDTQANIGK